MMTIIIRGRHRGGEGGGWFPLLPAAAEEPVTEPQPAVVRLVYIGMPCILIWHYGPPVTDPPFYGVLCWALTLSSGARL